MISPEQRAEIRRLFYAEHWRVGTIARQLHLHRGTVVRVLSQAGLPRHGAPARRSQIEPDDLDADTRGKRDKFK